MPLLKKWKRLRIERFNTDHRSDPLCPPWLKNKPQRTQRNTVSVIYYDSSSDKLNTMKKIILIAICLVSLHATGQTKNFPQDWTGDWKGELQWYRTGKEEPQKVNMELRIHPADSINTWTWQIIYGSATEDNRPYKLVMKDTAGIHWAIDELNGIVLDQYWVANKFCGAFTVNNATIVNNYWMENDKLVVEFYSLAAKPVATTGNGTEDSPHVDSYRVGSYQKAVLNKVK